MRVVSFGACAFKVECAYLSAAHSLQLSETFNYIYEVRPIYFESLCYIYIMSILQCGSRIGRTQTPHHITNQSYSLQ